MPSRLLITLRHCQEITRRCGRDLGCLLPLTSASTSLTHLVVCLRRALWARWQQAPDLTPSLVRVISFQCLTLLTLTPSGPADAQSPDMQDADRTYEAGSDAYLQATDALAAGQTNAARASFATAIDHLRKAQALLRRDLYRYQLSEALSLRGLGRAGEAWTLLRALASQTDAPELAALAKTQHDDITTRLAALNHGLLLLDCGPHNPTIRLAPPPTPAAEPPTHPALNRWMPCADWTDGHVLPAATYTLTARRPAGEPVTRTVSLAAGDRRRIAVHHLIAPIAPAIATTTPCDGCMCTGNRRPETGNP